MFARQTQSTSKVPQSPYALNYIQRERDVEDQESDGLL